MTYYFTGFVRSPGGLLKMIQILIGLVLMLILMGGHYDISTGLYRLRIDAFLMTMTVFTFVLTSALLLMCTIMGSTDLPNSVLYRINYLLATITYFPFTVGFIFEEYMHGDIKQTIAGGVLSVTNSLIYMFNLCVSYELRCLKPRRRVRQPKNGKKSKGGKGKGAKGKKGTVSEMDILMGRGPGGAAGRGGRIRNERDLLATGDVETFQRLQQIQRMNRLLENDPLMFHQQASYMIAPQPSYLQNSAYAQQAGLAGGAVPMSAQLHGGTAAGGGMDGPRRLSLDDRLAPRDDRLARRVVHEVYRGEFLPGEEYLMKQPAVGKEFIVPIKVEGRTTTSETIGSPKKDAKKDTKKDTKKDSKSKKKGSKSKKKGSKSKKGSKGKKGSKSKKKDSKSKKKGSKKKKSKSKKKKSKSKKK